MKYSSENDEIITKKVLKKLDIPYESVKYFSDGVSSRVFLLNDHYLVKQNTPSQLQAETVFLNEMNSNNIFQKIVYADNNYDFVVYDFIPGDMMKKVDDINETLKSIIKITSNYPRYTGKGFGFLNEEFNSWSEFLEDEIEYSSKTVNPYIKNNSNVYKCINILEKYSFEKKLLHGDFGTHNFVKVNGKLVGVIDPMPIIGDPLYDSLFAMVSNKDFLNTLTLENLVRLTNEPKEKLKAMLTIVTYSSISRCIKYHPNDVETYIKFWDKLNLEN